MSLLNSEPREAKRENTIPSWLRRMISLEKMILIDHAAVYMSRYRVQKVKPENTSINFAAGSFGSQKKLSRGII